MPPEISVVGENLVETWGWQIAVYLFLGGLVAGLMIFSGFMRLSRSKNFNRSMLIADLAGFPLLAFGMLFLLLDLSNKLNVWRLFTTFQPTSIMSWGAWILLLAMLFLAFRFAAAIGQPKPASFLGMKLFQPPVEAETEGGEAEDKTEKEEKPIRKPSFIVTAIEWVWSLLYRIGEWVRRRNTTFAVIGLLLGIGVGFYTGVLLSTIPSRPLWNTALLAPLFLTSGLASGGAFLCLFLPHEEHNRLVPFSVLFCGVELLLLFALIINLNYGNLAIQRAGSFLLSGTLGWVFWIVVFVFGLLVPATIELMEMLQRRVKFIPALLPPVLKLTGSLALRFVIVFAGLLSFV